MRPWGSIVRCHARLTVAIAATLSVACAGDSPIAPSTPAALTQLPRPLSATEQRLVDGSNGFAFSLLRAGDSLAGPDSNVFISPLSASMALGMTATGAAGATLDSMRAVLGYRDLPVSQMAASYHSLITLLRSLDPAVDVRIANAIWYTPSLPVLPSSVATARSDFDAPVTAAQLSDTATKTTINYWIDANTDGKIPTLLDAPLPDSSVMFLADAIYFHGSWRQRFDPAQTRDTLFATRSGSTEPVRLMHIETSARVHVTPRDTAVDLSYGNDTYTMTVIVPAAGMSVDSIVTELRAGEWRALTQALAASTGEARVDVELPKFRLSWRDTLNDLLRALGMGIAFDRGAADFSNMAAFPPGRLYISFVLQKTFIDVDEEGTTAAAATGVDMVVPGAVVAPIAVHADHPFVYVLRERLTGTILFAGIFAHPPAK